MEVNVTTPLTPSQASPVYPQYVGYICCALAALFLGSNFTVVKKFETGNGIFFNWMLCNGILITGYVIHIVRQSEVYPFVMLGGVIFTTGSMCIVPIVSAIGLGLGLCIWASVTLIIGWGNARFGILGVDMAVPSNVIMNYIGVCFSLISAVLYALVKPTPALKQPDVQKTDYTRTTENDVDNISDGSKSRDLKSNQMSLSIHDGEEAIEQEVKNDDMVSIIAAWSPLKRKIFGIGLAVGSGSMYGMMFVPGIYVQQHYEGASQNPLDYVFSMYCGIHLTSTCFLAAYMIYSRNYRAVYPKVIFPGMLSGAMWASGVALWFVANGTLSVAVSFPIITTLPQAISLLLGILVFKEIRGILNIVLVAVAMAFNLVGAVLAGLSK